MFDKEKFGKVIKKINDTYPTQYDFADKSGVNRTYLSQYINQKLSFPPKPKILEKIADASKGITTYDELMQICGYTNYMYDWFFNDSVHQRGNNIPIISDIKYDISKNTISVFSGSDFITANFKLEENKEYFAYQTQDDSMLPLLGVGDIAIIEKTNTYENGNTCLLLIDNNTVLIRKIIDFKDYIELQTAFPYAPYIKIANDELEKRNFKILRKSY